jgi:hypothetical protein
MDADRRPATRVLDFRTETNPRKCMLLIGIPINRDDFLQDYRRWPDQDYASFVAAAAGGEPEAAWTKDGAYLSQRVAELIEAANTSGIHVAARATKSDFTAPFAEGAEVVILVTHWRGSRVAGRDLLCDPEACAAAIFDSVPSTLSGETVQELHLRVSAALRDMPPGVPASERRHYFADQLTKHVISASEPLPGLFRSAANSEHVVVSDLWLETRHRDALDLCAGGTILPGNRVELRDGLHSPSSLAALVPKQWSGLIDLSMCRSVILGDSIKQGRSDRGMIVRTKTCDPTFTLTLMRRLFIELGSSAHNYASRYSELFDAAQQIIQETVKNEPRGRTGGGTQWP